MTVRTTSKTVTFMHPFGLSGTDEMQSVGTYTGWKRDEEPLETSSLPAYRRISTLMRLPARTTDTMPTQIVGINPVELAAALARDTRPAETVPQPTPSRYALFGASTGSRRPRDPRPLRELSIRPCRRMLR